jgi:hypothetical protein
MKYRVLFAAPLVCLSLWACDSNKESSSEGADPKTALEPASVDKPTTVREPDESAGADEPDDEEEAPAKATDDSIEDDTEGDEE